MSCLFGDFNVYGSQFPNNIRLSRRMTPTDIIVQMQSYKLPLELRLRNCVGNLNADPLHKITVLHRGIKHFDRMPRNYFLAQRHSPKT